MRSGITIAIIDQHPAVIEGLRAVLGHSGSGITVATTAASAAEFVQGPHMVDVVLIDTHLADEYADKDFAAIHQTGASILVYTDEERVVPLQRAVKSGVAGVLCKRDPLGSLPQAISEAVRNDFVCSPNLAQALLDNTPNIPALSQRQVQILRAIHEGLDRRATARVLGITEGAVKTHLSRIREKFQRAGVEPGNSHHLTHLASVVGYLP